MPKKESPSGKSKSPKRLKRSPVEALDRILKATGMSKKETRRFLAYAMAIGEASLQYNKAIAAAKETIKPPAMAIDLSEQIQRKRKSKRYADD